MREAYIDPKTKTAKWREKQPQSKPPVVVQRMVSQSDECKTIDHAARDAANRCVVLAQQARPWDMIRDQMKSAIADEMRWLANRSIERTPVR